MTKGPQADGVRNILLFDVYSSSELGQQLRAILDHRSEYPLRVLHERAGSREVSSMAGQLSAVISRFSPQATLFVLPPGIARVVAPLFTVLQTHCSAAALIAVLDEAEPEEVLQLLSLGANDFLLSPLRQGDVMPRLWRLLTPNRSADPAVQELKETLGLHQFVGESPSFIAEIKRIAIIARCDASVLVAGETGTGKELCAQAIHYCSPRAGKPFIALNCGAIPVELVENELFGHEIGAFTSAASRAGGLLREADGGTLFLDEIDSLPLPAQVKLLRFLQAKEYRPLGSSTVHRADLRVIAATNVSLEEMILNKRFRQDLYYRLHVLGLTLPALRHRGAADIQLLARHFLAKFAAQFEKPCRNFTPGAMQRLVLYDWPGNIRELENVIERSVAFSDHVNLESNEVAFAGAAASASLDSFQSLKEKTIAQFERKYLSDILQIHGGNISRAAQAAGKHRRAFYELMRKHKLSAQQEHVVREDQDIPASGCDKIITR